MGPLKEGLYDQLLTRRLRERIAACLDAGGQALIEPLAADTSPGYLARHLAREIRTHLRALPAKDKLQRQVELTDLLLRQLASPEECLEESPEVLKAIYRTARPPDAPTTPLADTHLMMNAPGEPRLGFELERELATSDSVLMLVSFLQWRGWQRLKHAFLDLESRGVPVRILTTTYIGATEYAALEQLARRKNVELKISLDGRRRRLHAKAWLFHRDNGFSTVYVGSANLSGPALEEGIEWTVKLSEVESPHVVERFRGAFDSLWCDEEFETFRLDDEDLRERVKRALQQAGGASSGHTVLFDLRPHSYQQATLDRLEAERLDRGFRRNLVVAPTGTGKTMVAAFDYARQPYTGRRPKLLFLAHREELLKQARYSFRHVLRDGSFGELLASGHEPASYDHLFATIQSFRSRELLRRLGPDHWDYVVLDEAHHAPAEGYRDVLGELRPNILLGLTATPERMDGQGIERWFDDRIADEMRLWHAIERQYLAPFDYYGVHDETDLSTLSWSRGAYNAAELESQYIGNRRRAELVVAQFHEIHGSPRQARALGFCVSIAHARFMAEVFESCGIPALALTSESSAEERNTASLRLRDREINVIFTVDLFNEGIDIPEVDCILFLRPTESATVFLQQLGRGLRISPGKSSCLVLDFIGYQRKEFRFDRRFLALFGGTRSQLRHAIETGVTMLPGNCYFRLDQESRKAVLENLRAQLRGSFAQKASELRALAQQTGGRPSLSRFLEETGYEPEDVFSDKEQGWHSLLHEAGLLHAAPSHGALTSQFRFLLHVDSVSRLALYARLLEQGGEPAGEAERRMAAMLTLQLLQQAARSAPELEGLHRLQKSEGARQELLELLEALRARVKTHSDEIPWREECPLHLHRRYSRREVFAALGKTAKAWSWQAQEGCFRIDEMNAEVLFVTLDKSGKSFSPTTRYEDFAVSRTRFHWQSQGKTTPESPAGQRYIRQREQGTSFLLLVRATKKDAFVYLGPVKYVSHSGSRPMSIYWDLEQPMPAWYFEVCAALRAA